MFGQVPVLSVYRHEMARSDKREHQLELLGTAVPGHVHRLALFVNHLGAAVRDVIHHPADRPPVTRNRARGEHDHVIRLEHDVAVIIDRDPRECGERLALRTGRHADHVPGGVVPDVAVPDLETGRQPQVPQPFRDLRVLDHSAPGERQLATELDGEVGDNLDPMQAGGEGGDHDLAGGAAEHLFESLHDVELRACEPRSLDIRAVAEHCQYAGAPELRESVHVERLAVERGLVELEIPRVNDDASRGVDRHRDAVGHAVRHPDEFEGDIGHGHRVTGRHLAQPVHRLQPMLLQLRRDERQRERRSVDGTVEERPDIRQGADMVLVPVCQHHRREAADTLLQIAEVRDDQVHPQ